MYESARSSALPDDSLPGGPRRRPSPATGNAPLLRNTPSREGSQASSLDHEVQQFQQLWAEIKKDLPPQLSRKHISMISIGGVIGTGLFLGSGNALRSGGPVGAFFGYALIGSVVYCLCVSVGEMIAFLPNVGGVVGLADLYVDKALGFSLGWAAWYNWAVTLPAEVAAAAILTKYWNPHVPVAAVSGGFLALATLVNCFPSRLYGELEFYLSTFKVATIVFIIILSLLVDFGVSQQGPIGLERWLHPAFGEDYLGITGHLGGFLGFLAVLMQASFSFFGSEVPGIAAGEVIDANRNVPQALNRVWVRITLFYVGGILSAGLIVDWKKVADPEALHGTSVNSSPFVIAFKQAGWHWLAHGINAAVLVSAWSAAASDIYISSRFLFFLSRRGHAPAIFASLIRSPEGSRVPSARKTPIPRPDSDEDLDREAEEQLVTQNNDTDVVAHIDMRDSRDQFLHADDGLLDHIRSSPSPAPPFPAIYHGMPLAMPEPQIARPALSTPAAPWFPQPQPAGPMPQRPNSPPHIMITGGPSGLSLGDSASEGLFSAPPTRPTTLEDTDRDPEANHEHDQRKPRPAIPLWAVLGSSSVGLLCFLDSSHGTAPEMAFTWLVAVASVASLQSWAGMLYTYIRWYKGTVYAETETIPSLEANGQREKADAIKKEIARIKKHRRPGQPYLAYYAFSICIFVLLTNGWSVFLHSGWKIAEVPGQMMTYYPSNQRQTAPISQFLSSYVPLPFFALLTFGYKLMHGTQMVPLEDMSFEPKAIPKIEHEPQTWFEKKWSSVLQILKRFWPSTPSTRSLAS